MSKIDGDVAEIVAFIKKIRFDNAITSNDRNKTTFKAAYKQFHALLVWGMITETQSNSPLPIKTYFRESLSDVSHAFLLTLLNFYKPACGSLRSSVENFIRATLLFRGVDATKINSVYELFDTAKIQFSGESLLLKSISNLHAEYANLCITVHSAKIDYMSQAVPFEEMHVASNGRFGTNIVSLRRVCIFSNQVLFLLLHAELKKVGPKNEDLVRDSIPRALKREAEKNL